MARENLPALQEKALTVRDFFRVCAYIIVAAVICAVPMSAVAQVTEPPPLVVDPPTEVEVPSKEFPTIQSAIEALPDGSTIRLALGRYTESLTVTGKSLDIIGSGAHGRRRTQIVGDDPDAAVITFGPGGGGSVQNLVLRGGAIGIEGVRGEDGDDGRYTRPAPLLVRRTLIRHVGQGIFGSFSHLTLQGIVVRHIDWNGICITTIDSLEVLNSYISNTEAVGILVFNYEEGEGTINIAYNIFEQCEQGGLAIVGDAKDVVITHCSFWKVNLAGILLLEVGQVLVQDTVVAKTQAVDAPDFSNVGDGLLASSEVSVAFIEIDNCDFRRCDRAGILFNNCGGVIKNTKSRWNAYGLVIQGHPQPDYLGEGNTFESNDEANIEWGGDIPVADTIPPPTDPDT